MRTWLGGAVLIAVVSCAVGWAAHGGQRTDEPTWRTGTVHVSTEGKEATFFEGGSASGFFSSVAWIDSTGAVHEERWPACLTDQTRDC